MKPLILLILTIFFSHLAVAQINPQFRLLWQFNVSDTVSDTYFTSECRQLDDSSLVIISRQFEQLPAEGSKPIGYYLSKVTESGQLVINRKKMDAPGSSFYLLNADITSDGGLVAIFVKDRTGLPQTKTDSVCLVKYDTDLEMVWLRWVSNQHNGGVEPSRVTSCAALNDGKIIVGYNRRDQPRGPRELVSNLALFTAFSAQGDSLFTRDLTDPILQIRKGSDSAFFIRVDHSFGSDEYSETFLHSAKDGATLKHLFALLPSGISFISNFALIPATQQFVAVTVPAWTNSTNFSLQIADALLNHQYTLDYNNVSLFNKIFWLRLFKDKEAGIYAFQYQPTDFPILRDTVAFCRLNAVGDIIWSYKTANATSIIGGEISDIFPMAGNDFILVISHPGGLKVKRMTTDTSIDSQITRHQVLEKKSTLSHADPAKEIHNNFFVRVIANPSPSFFTFIVEGSTQKPLTLLVSDIEGRLIEKKQLIPSNAAIQMGQSYKPGIYFVHCSQNGKTQVLKIIKQ